MNSGVGRRDICINNLIRLCRGKPEVVKFTRDTAAFHGVNICVLRYGAGRERNVNSWRKRLFGQVSKCFIITQVNQGLSTVKRQPGHVLCELGEIRAHLCQIAQQSDSCIDPHYIHGIGDWMQ